MDNEIINLLKRNGMSVTESRKKILTLFLKSRGALEHAGIESSIKTLDRVTIYRTLQSFMEKGIIHTIPSNDNTIKYALCRNCTQGHHHDDHVHFKCERCGLTTCLEHVSVPAINLPQKYVSLETEIVVKGICENCNMQPA